MCKSDPRVALAAGHSALPLLPGHPTPPPPAFHQIQSSVVHRAFGEPPAHLQAERHTHARTPCCKSRGSACARLGRCGRAEHSHVGQHQPGMSAGARDVALACARLAGAPPGAILSPWLPNRPRSRHARARSGDGAAVEHLPRHRSRAVPGGWWYRKWWSCLSLARSCARIPASHAHADPTASTPTCSLTTHPNLSACRHCPPAAPPRQLLHALSRRAGLLYWTPPHPPTVDERAQCRGAKGARGAAGQWQSL